MPNQLTLAYTVNVAGSSYGPAKAALALAAVPLYANPTNDPVLGQFFGLTIASDLTTQTATTATRTIKINMTSVDGVPTAPPPFPCNPITATPPILSYATLAYFGEVMVFFAGDLITGGTSGATATVVQVNPTSLILVNVTGAFRTGETVTGVPSGATAKAGSIDYIAETGVFDVGDTVTGTLSTAIGVVSAVVDNGKGAGYLIFSSTTGVFQIGEILTGVPSGATATSGSAVVPPSYYPLLTTRTLPGYFLTTPGSALVPTAFSQLPSITPGVTIQFLAQPGVFYKVLTVIAASITLTTPYTGVFSEDEGAVVMVPAPAQIAAIYSTSPLDSAGVAITPALPPGSGARTISLTYFDSTGAGPFTVTTSLMGTYPAPVTLHAGSIDIATITDMHVASTGGFGNSVGQITLCQMSSAPLYIRPNLTAQQFQALTDQAQNLITRGLVYLPPSYFALAQQDASQPWNPSTAGSLAGEFILPGRMAHAPNVQGGVSVATTVNQTAPPPPSVALAATNIIEFAAQPGVLYTVAAVGTGTITLTTPWTGLNDNPIASSATLITPSPAAEPTNAQLSTDAGEFVNPGTAVPPPNPPLAPQTMTPSPIFLSGMFARTLQLALAVPVVPSAIVLS